MAKKKRVYPKEFLEYVQSITNKRAKVVIDHILAHGFITTEGLEKTYGYNHPPRAARDVREAGIPLETFKIKSSCMKYMADAARFVTENLKNAIYRLTIEFLMKLAET